MSVVYLDTHIAVFLHDGLIEELSVEAKRQIETNDLLISPMVFLEFEYLFERKRVRATAQDLYNVLHADFGVTMCNLPFPRIATEALKVNWTSDPFDRLIVANAQANRAAVLITRDKAIRKNYFQAFW